MFTPILSFIDGEAFGGLVLLAVIVLAVLSGRSQAGSPLVLKSWYASNAPMADGSFIHITGRRSGFIGWLFALLGIDPVTTLKVSATRIEFHASSLTGTAHRITPLGSVSSSYFGYHKPLFAAIFVGLFVGFLSMSLIGLVIFAIVGPGAAGTLLGLLSAAVFGILAAFLYFKFNKTQTIGFVEVSGFGCEIRFKPSVIEGVNVDEAQAKYAAELMQHLIQSRVDR